MYEVAFDGQAISFLEKLDSKIARRIWDKIQSAKENPRRFFERLSKRTDFKLRVGDYRVIADIDDRKRLISVTLIGHRKNIYKN